MLLLPLLILLMMSGIIWRGRVGGGWMCAVHEREQSLETNKNENKLVFRERNVTYFLCTSRNHRDTSLK